MTLVRAHCRTNIDKYRLVEWPNFLVGVPHNGDHVESLDGKHRLAVVRVTHKTNRDRGTVRPYIEVELHYDRNMAELARLTAEREKEGD